MFAVNFFQSNAAMAYPNQLNNIRLTHQQNNSQHAPNIPQASTDKLDISENARSVNLINQSFTFASQDGTSPLTAFLSGLQNISTNTSKGILDLSTFGLGKTEVMLERTKDGNLNSKRTTAFKEIKIGDESYQAQVSIKNNQVSLQFNNIEKNETTPITETLNQIFSLDANTGIQALKIAQNSGSESFDELNDFISGLRTVLPQSGETPGIIDQYLTVFKHNSNRSEDIVNRLQISAPENTARFLNAAKNAGNEFNTFLYTLDHFNQQTGGDFLQTADYAGNDLKSLLEHFNSFDKENLKQSYHILPNLNEYTNDFIHQLDQVNKENINDYLDSLSHADKQAGLLASQYARIDEFRIQEYVDLAVSAEKNVGNLAKQTARIDIDQLDSFLNFASTIAEQNHLSLFLNQIERIENEDINTFLDVGKNAKDKPADFLYALNQVEDKNITQFLNASMTADENLPEFLNQFHRIKNEEIPLFLNIIETAGIEGFSSLYHFK